MSDMLSKPEGAGEFLSALYEEITTRIGGVFVDDDREKSEVSVHLRGWKHRTWDAGTRASERNVTSQRKVYLFVQIRINDRLAHELDLNCMMTPPASLNMLLRCYLCPVAARSSYGIVHTEPEANLKGAEQTEFLCRAVEEFLQASARSQVLQGNAT